MTKKNSKWEVRQHPSISKSMLKIVRELQVQNIGVQEEMWTIAGSANKIEVLVKTTINIRDEQREHLLEALREEFKNSPDVHFEVRTPQDLRTILRIVK